MKITAQKTFIAAIVVLFCITLIPACQDETIQESPSDAKRVRMLEFEKSQLEKQIQDLGKTHAKELDDQKKLLDKCEKQNKKLKGKAAEHTEELLNQMLMPLMEEVNELKRENADLKEQIRQLKGS
ncbi:MAG: hypothetical protein ACYSWP_05495 [Planctomycetota bacterium]